MSTWWSEWREVYFQLMTLSTSAPWDLPAGGARVYSDDTFSFHESELKGNFDEVEEQLWATRRGLSDRPITLPQRKQLKPDALKKPARGPLFRPHRPPRTNGSNRKSPSRFKKKNIFFDGTEKHELARCVFTELNLMGRLENPGADFVYCDEMCVQLYLDVLGHGVNAEMKPRA